MHSIKASEQFANTYPGESASPIWGKRRERAWLGGSPPSHALSLLSGVRDTFDDV